MSATETTKAIDAINQYDDTRRMARQLAENGSAETIAYWAGVNADYFRYYPFDHEAVNWQAVVQAFRSA